MLISLFQHVTGDTLMAIRKAAMNEAKADMCQVLPIDLLYFFLGKRIQNEMHQVWVRRFFALLNLEVARTRDSSLNTY